MDLEKALGLALIPAILAGAYIWLTPGPNNAPVETVFKTDQPAKPGNFSEASAPELRVSLPQSVDYAPPDFPAFTAKIDGAERKYFAVGPNPSTSGKEPPVVILLHGSRRDGRSMLDMWQALAKKKGITLIAPDASGDLRWSMAAEGPDFLQHILDDAKQHVSFDPKRVYLFGHSAGAIHALMLANRSVGPWRAVAVHAGTIDVESAVTHPDGVPVRIYIGERDTTFPLDQVRAGANALAQAGHNTELKVIPGHTHWYYVIGPKLADHAWSFFEKH
jgi:predicted esterase